MNRILRLLYAHLDTHPEAEICDAVNFLYEASFGGGYMISDSRSSYIGLCKEADSLPKTREAAPVEDLGDFVRLDLSILERISPATMNAMLLASRRSVSQDKQPFLSLLDDFAASAYFDAQEKQDYLRQYAASGYPEVLHSDAYCAAYSPSYRIIRKEYIPFLNVFSAIDARRKDDQPILIAIDGQCGSGKSTLGRLLYSVYPCNLFHTDDFFLPKSMRTPERYATPGGNIHWERIRDEIIVPVKNGTPFSFRKFDCSKMDYGETVCVQPEEINILEGSYSVHPALIDAYTLKIFLKTSPEIQSARILARDGAEKHAVFLQKWIPLENLYFEKISVEKQCDFVFTT